MLKNLPKDNIVLKNETILKEIIKEEDKVLKYILNITILLGAFGFFIVGISSYLGYNLIPFLNATQIIFFPQGLTMLLYGTAGIIIGINQLKILVLEIGEGYNEFNKKKGTLTVFRKGIKGKISDINIVYLLTDIVRFYNL